MVPHFPPQFTTPGILGARTGGVKVLSSLFRNFIWLGPSRLGEVGEAGVTVGRNQPETGSVSP